MSFNEHGKYKLYIDFRLIILIAEGQWNLEASEACIAEFGKLVDGMEGQDFGVLVDTTKVEGITPDSFEAWVNAIDAWYPLGHKATARVDDPNSPHYKIFLSGFDDIFKSKMAFQYSGSIDAGVQWLNSLGYLGFERGIEGFVPITNEKT